MPSVLDAVGRVAGRASGLYKTEWWGAGVVMCLERGADLHTAQLMPLPLTVSCFSKIRIGFTFLVLAHPGSPRKGPLNGCLFVFCLYINTEETCKILINNSESLDKYCQKTLRGIFSTHTVLVHSTDAACF